MERILIFIKHHFRFLWKIIDWGNGLLYRCLYKAKQQAVLQEVLLREESHSLVYRELEPADIPALKNLIDSQPPQDLRYFSPHGFDMVSLQEQKSKAAFLMMGIFEEQKMLGYFFLRFFANKKCFVGRLIDRDHRGQGIGAIMNSIMYETAWGMGFRCLSTISRKNKMVMGAHAKNPTMLILKELQNDYLLVEFVKKIK
jgi:RimJ/RimL family protein N-acetyltransferase